MALWLWPVQLAPSDHGTPPPMIVPPIALNLEGAVFVNVPVSAPMG